MKKKFDCDEWYPVYYFDEGSWARYEADFTEEEIKFINDAMVAIDKAQDIFGKKYEEVKK